jgi:cytochrome P450
MVSQVSTTKHKAIPYIREFPLIGSIVDFNNDRLNFILRLAREYDVCGFHMGPIPFVLFNKPEYIQSILVEHGYDFTKGSMMHKAITGNGLFISEGDFHRRQRKLMAPKFQPRYIASYADTMVHYAEQIQQEWPNGSLIDINRQMIGLTMSIIGKIVFDADIFTETDELGEAMTTVFAYTTHVLSSVITPPLSWPTPMNIRTRRASQILVEHVQSMIDERRNRPTERNDILSILLQAQDEDGSHMSNEQLLDECLTLFGAGHETTAAALTWAWYLLCQYPEVYQRVRDEVDSVLHGRTPTYADLVHLPYCLQVFKETLRLYPPAYAIVREAASEIEIDGYSVHKGQFIFVSPYVLQRDPQYFPEPEKFEPERFTPEREKQIPRYVYMPFGAGPRVCIGNHLAMMEGHLLLATLAQRVNFALLPGQTVKWELDKTLALRPYGKVNVSVTRR